MTPEALRDLVNKTLEDFKAREVVTLAVADITDITDFMIIATGTSSRHVKALVDNVVTEMKSAGVHARGIEGRETNEEVVAYRSRRKEAAPETGKKGIANSRTN